MRSCSGFTQVFIYGFRPYHRIMLRGIPGTCSSHNGRCGCDFDGCTCSVSSGVVAPGVLEYHMTLI